VGTSGSHSGRALIFFLAPIYLELVRSGREGWRQAGGGCSLPCLPRLRTLCLSPGHPVIPFWSTARHLSAFGLSVGWTARSTEGIGGGPWPAVGQRFSRFPQFDTWGAVFQLHGREPTVGQEKAQRDRVLREKASLFKDQKPPTGPLSGRRASPRGRRIRTIVYNLLGACNLFLGRHGQNLGGIDKTSVEALPKGTVPFSSNENWDSPPLEPAPILTHFGWYNSSLGDHLVLENSGKAAIMPITLRALNIPLDAGTAWFFPAFLILPPRVSRRQHGRHES
jgi:hypothetical protein